MDSATTLAVWAKAISCALTQQGIDPSPILQQCDIDLRQIDDPDARLPVTTTAKLMQLASEKASSPVFGLHVGRCVRPTTWHALGYSIWASATLREGFQRLVKYGRLFSTVGSAKVSDHEGIFTVELIINPMYQEVIIHEQLDAVLTALVLICQQLNPEEFKLHKISLTRETPEHSADFDDLFHCPIEYGAATAALHLPATIVDSPLATANASLALVNDQLCEEYLARMDQSDFAARVRCYLAEKISYGEPQIKYAAEALSSSTRSLQRRLTEQGTTFNELVDQVRQELAMKYIDQNHLSISDISYNLGFAHTSNFSRAFKRWTGFGPTEYRKQRYKEQG